MGSISPIHLLLVLVVALIVIGPSRLPETGAALGKALRQFRDAANGLDPDDATTTPAATPTSQVTAAATIASASAPAPVAAPSGPTADAPAAPAPLTAAAPSGPTADAPAAPAPLTAAAPPPVPAPSDPDSATPQA